MDEFERLGQVGIRKFINSHVKIDTEEKIKAIARYLKDKNSRNEAIEIFGKSDTRKCKNML